MTSQRELFGGSINLTIPNAFIDVSTIRQVPDTQEVFVAPSDVSFIVELLEKVDADDADEAARFHFGSLAHDNDAISSQVHSVELPQASPTTSTPGTTPPPTLLDGSQQIAKFNRSYKDEVRILLALYRIAAKNVDIVFSANIPIKTENGPGLDPMQVSDAKEVFLSAAKSLRIVDSSLFAGGEGEEAT